MKLPIKWLEGYGDIKTINFSELIDDENFSGFIIRGAEELLVKSNKIQIGKLKTIEPHPDADQLVVIQVCVGEEELVQIVTGATNCTVGDFVPIVRKNGRIADGTKIKKGKLRGVESYGMLCSLEELGYDPKVVQDEMVDNIYILNNDHGNYKSGDDFKESIPDVMDTVLTLEFTDGPLTIENISLELQNKYMNMDDTFNKEINDNPNETINLLRNLKEETESPDWLKIRLMNVGIKPSTFKLDCDAYFKFISN